MRQQLLPNCSRHMGDLCNLLLSIPHTRMTLGVAQARTMRGSTTFPAAIIPDALLMIPDSTCHSWDVLKLDVVDPHHVVPIDVPQLHHSVLWCSSGLNHWALVHTKPERDLHFIEPHIFVIRIAIDEELGYWTWRNFILKRRVLDSNIEEKHRHEDRWVIELILHGCIFVLFRRCLRELGVLEELSILGTLVSALDCSLGVVQDGENRLQHLATGLQGKGVSVIHTRHSRPVIYQRPLWLIRISHEMSGPILVKDLFHQCRHARVVGLACQRCQQALHLLSNERQFAQLLIDSGPADVVDHCEELLYGSETRVCFSKTSDLRLPSSVGLRLRPC
mmetsp:Transcript_58907/g.140592  ORF Transcript_58907/g.140592 Transcript_58907/m.140592 type:complete len:334 (-) Transcript_58907:429-1430(-)